MCGSLVPSEVGLQAGSLSKARHLPAKTEPVDLARTSSWRPSAPSHSSVSGPCVDQSLLVMKLREGVLCQSQAGKGKLKATEQILHSPSSLPVRERAVGLQSCLIFLLGAQPDQSPRLWVSQPSPCVVGWGHAAEFWNKDHGSKWRGPFPGLVSNQPSLPTTPTARTKLLLWLPAWVKKMQWGLQGRW